MEQAHLYDIAWQDLRSRILFLRNVEKGWGLVLLILVVPVILATTSVIILPRSRDLTDCFLAAMAILVIVRIIADKRLNSFLCPRCNEPFMKIEILCKNPLYEIDDSSHQSLECRNCLLPLWSNNDDMGKSG